MHPHPGTQPTMECTWANSIRTLYLSYPQMKKGLLALEQPTGRSMCRPSLTSSVRRVHWLQQHHPLPIPKYTQTPIQTHSGSDTAGLHAMIKCIEYWGLFGGQAGRRCTGKVKTQYSEKNLASAACYTIKFKDALRGQIVLPVKLALTNSSNHGDYRFNYT